jgi:hypothetical protein
MDYYWRNYHRISKQIEVDHCILSHDHQENLEVYQSPLPGNVMVDIVQKDLLVEHIDLVEH